MKFYILLLFSLSYSLVSAQNIKLFEQDGKWGAKNARGKTIAKAKYDKARILNFSESQLLLVQTGNKSLLINEQGKRITPFKNQGIHRLGDKYLFVWIAYKGRIINLEGKNIIKDIQNGEISSFWKGSAYPFKIKNKWGFLNQHTLDLTIPFIYDELDTPYISSYPGIASLKKDDKYTLINKLGSIVSDSIFEDIHIINAGALAKQNGKWGIIDSLGNTTIPFIYDSYYYKGHETLALNTSDGIRFASKYTGKFLSEAVYDSQKSFTKAEHFLKVSKDGKWGIVNPATGAELTAAIYDSVHNVRLDGNKIHLQKNGKWGAMDYDGNKLLDCVYDKIVDHVYVPSIVLKQNEKYGFADRNSYEIFTSCIYDDCKTMGHRTFKLKLGNKWGLCVVNLIRLMEKTEEGYKQSSIPYFTPIEYDEIAYNGSDSFVDFVRIRQGDKWGFLNIHYRVQREEEIYAVPCIYEDLGNSSKENHGWAPAKKDGKWGAIDITNSGKVVIDFSFDTIRELYQAHPDMIEQRAITM